MGLELEPEILIAIACAIGAGLMFVVVALILAGSAGGPRYQRRLTSMQERARGIPTTEAAVARSLSRQQGGTMIDRVARNWLPRRDLLLARLARTGRAITIGQYAMAAAGLAVLSAICVATMTPIGIIPSLLIGVLIGAA